MGKNNVENSLKRFLKRKVKITMGFVVAFMIMGTGVFAADEYYAKDEDITVEETGDITIKVNTSVSAENTNRFTALGAEAGKTLNLTTTGKINIVNDSSIKNPQRLYGITLNGGANANVSANEINFNISGTDESVRGIRNNGGGDLTINGNITGTLSNTNDTLQGIEVWYGGNIIINGTVDLNLKKDGAGFLSAFKNRENEGKELTFKNIVNSNIELGENYTGVDIGGVNTIEVNHGIINFEKNTNITILNKSNISNEYNYVNAVRLQCDPGDKYPTFVNFYGDKTELIIKSVGESTGETIGIYSSGVGGSVNFKGKEAIIDVSSNSSKYVVGLSTQYGGNVKNDTGTKLIIKATSNSVDKDSLAQGINVSQWNGYNGNISLDGSVDITAQANAGKSFGISNVANNNVKDTKDGKILIGENLHITATSKTGQAIGVYTTGIYGETKLNGNTVIEVKGNEDSYALNALDKGKIDITGKDKLVQITGDINAETKGTISANLSTSDSFITGTITDNNGNTETAQGTVNIGIDNGAKWNNTGSSSVTELTLNNGVINNNSIDNNISVETLKGNGGAVNMAAAIDEATGKATSGKVTINNIEKENVKLDVNFKNSGTVEADGDKAQEYFEELAKNIETTDTDSKITGTAALDEGFVSGGYEADITINKDGSKVENVTYTGLNSMIEGMRDLATINLLTWRQEMNSLNKRMGELRNSTGEHGVWSRVYTGKIENGSKYDNDYQTYQVGYDKKYTVDNGVMFVGGLVSYTDGETDYALGHGENYSVGAGIYATWLNNDGQFADVVLKQSRLHNKFDVRSIDGDKSQHGDYNNWGTSLSGQYGKRFDLNDKFFVEPSVELTLGRVDDTTYTTSAGVDVHQDTMYSLVGNVGTAVGYKFSDKGNVYARAALVKEFQGDIDTEYEKDGAVERTSEDLGDTWAEFGIGVNYRFVENMNVYVDVQKTGEATVDNKWQANLGFRYEF